MVSKFSIGLQGVPGYNFLEHVLSCLAIYNEYNGEYSMVTRTRSSLQNLGNVGGQNVQLCSFFCSLIGQVTLSHQKLV